MAVPKVGMAPDRRPIGRLIRDRTPFWASCRINSPFYRGFQEHPSHKTDPAVGRPLDTLDRKIPGPERHWEW